MRPRRIVPTLTAVILTLVPRADSIPVPALDLDRLAAQASIIAVGQITFVQELGKTTVQVGNRAVTAHTMSAELRADQLLKTPHGNAPPFLTFYFTLPDEFIGWRTVTPQSYGVFFLAESPSELKLASPYYPSLVAVPGGEVQEGTAIERVINQLRAVLESTTASVQVKREAIFALSRTKNPAAIRALSGAVQLRDFTLRLSAAAALREVFRRATTMR